MSIAITDDELFNELKNFLEPEFLVEKGIPINVSERGNPYETRVLGIPERMVNSIDDIIEILKNMARRATRCKGGDLVSVRASELSYSDGAYQIWLRLCVEDKNSPAVYHKVGGKLEKIATQEAKS